MVHACLANLWSTRKEGGISLERGYAYPPNLPSEATPLSVHFFGTGQAEYYGVIRVYLLLLSSFFVLVVEEARR